MFIFWRDMEGLSFGHRFFVQFKWVYAIGNVIWEKLQLHCTKEEFLLSHLVTWREVHTPIYSKTLFWKISNLWQQKSPLPKNAFFIILFRASPHPKWKENSVQFSNMYLHNQASTEARLYRSGWWNHLGQFGKHWLHTEYRVYTSYATVYTELVWPLISSLSFNCSAKWELV